MNILAISGALRAHSTNTGLLRALRDACPENVVMDIATLHGIPFYDGDVEAATGKPETVKLLEQKIRAAHAVIIATPEYNFSIPGVLKNATDWLSRGGSPFRRKRVGIVGSADGILGTGRAQYHLRQNLQGLEAVVMAKPEIFVGEASKKFNDKGDLTDVDTRARLPIFLKTFVEWCETPL